MSVAVTVGAVMRTVMCGEAERVERGGERGGELVWAVCVVVRAVVCVEADECGERDDRG